MSQREKDFNRRRRVATVLGGVLTPGFAAGGSALAADDGRAGRTAAGNLVGNVAGAGLGAALGYGFHKLTKGKHFDLDAALAVPAIAGALGGGAYGAYKGHGDYKKKK